MATDAGTMPLAWWFSRAGEGLGRLGGPLRQLASTLGLAQPLLAELRRLSKDPRSGEGRIARVLRIADEAFSSLPAVPPPIPEPPAPSAPRLLAAAALWLYGLAGLAGL
jgi:hypothetical protein